MSMPLKHCVHRYFKMRQAFLALLFLCTLAFAACSYSTAFVVVNDSDNPIQVQYTIKRRPGPLSSTETPVTIAASHVRNQYRSEWRSLSAGEYQTSQTEQEITVTVQVASHEALWVTSMFHYFGDDDPNDVASWPVTKISLTGVNGEMTFSGDKARKAFQYATRVLYTLTYN